jgi:hypothetical protein
MSGTMESGARANFIASCFFLRKVDFDSERRRNIRKRRRLKILIVRAENKEVWRIVECVFVLRRYGESSPGQGYGIDDRFL